MKHLILALLFCSSVFAQFGTSSVQDFRINFQDNDAGNASTNKHGFLRKLSGETNSFLNGTGHFLDWYDVLRALQINPFLNTATDLVGVGPYTNAVGAVASGTPNFGQNSGQTAYEWLSDGQQARLRQNGTIQQLRLYVGPTTGLSSFTVAVWREVSSGSFTRIGVTGNLLGSVTASAINTLTVNIPGVEEGDLIGGRLEFTSASAYNLFAYTGVSAVTNYATVNTATTTSGFAWRSQTATAGTIPVIQAFMEAPDFVFIGDSMMAGHGASDSEHYTGAESTYKHRPYNSMPYHLARLLGITYQNLGIGGQTRTNIDARLQSDVIALKPKFVFDWTGYNDIGGSTTATEYTNKWNFALSSYAAAGIRPIVGLVIGTDATSAANDVVTDTYNANLCRLIADAYTNAIIVNFKPWMCTNDSTAAIRTNLYNLHAGFTDDTVHPNGLGNRVGAQVAYHQMIGRAMAQRLIFLADRVLIPRGESFAGGSVISPGLANADDPDTGINPHRTAGTSGWSFYVNGTPELDISGSGIFWAADEGGSIGNVSTDRPEFVSVAEYIAWGPALTSDYTNDRQAQYTQAREKFTKREKGTAILNWEDSGLTTLTYAASTAIDLSLNQAFTVALTGDVTFTTSNRTAGKRLVLRIVADASARNLTFPSWTWVQTAPTSIAANKTMLVEVDFFGTTDANATARHFVQP